MKNPGIMYILDKYILYKILNIYINIFVLFVSYVYQDTKIVISEHVDIFQIYRSCYMILP